MSPQYLKHTLFLFSSSPDLASGRQRSRTILGHIISLHRNFCIRILGEPRDTEVTFSTWVYNMAAQMRQLQNIDKCLVFFIITGLQGKNFGNCYSRKEINY